jgi:hypothetical protein
MREETHVPDRGSPKVIRNANGKTFIILCYALFGLASLTNCQYPTITYSCTLYCCQAWLHGGVDDVRNARELSESRSEIATT